MRRLGLTDVKFFSQGFTSPEWWSRVFPGVSGRLILQMFIEHLRKSEGTLKRIDVWRLLGNLLLREDLLEEAGSGLL